jgi:hypothetical protein
MAKSERLMEGTLYRVVTRTFVAGVIVSDGRVVDAAPILRREIGKTLDDLKSSIENQGGTVIHCS